MALPLNIDDLIHQRKVESARIEYKKDWNPEKVLHSVCAFANDIDKKDCLDAADLDDTMADVFYVFSTGRGCQAAVEAIREQFDTSDLSSREFSTLTKLLVNASNATRHDSNWGYTPKEMAAMYGETADVPPAHYDFAVNPNVPVVRKEVKVGRNDPCPCGSGKKYKKCCGRGK